MALHEEIHEQPAVLERFLARQSGSIAQVVELLRARQVRGVLIVARGSSDHAGTYAKYVFGARNHELVTLATPSLFSRYGSPPDLGASAVLALSQSGQSPDIIAVCAEGRRQGRPTIAVTNDPRSPLALACDRVIELEAGPETSIAATKTYLAELLAVALWSAEWAEDRDARRAIAHLPHVIRDTLAGEDRLRELATRVASAESCVVLGRGFNLATAQEWALKLREMARVAASPFSPADFRHGPRAALGVGGWVLAVQAAGPVETDLRELLADLESAQRARTVVLGFPVRASHPESEIPIGENLPEWLTPFPITVAAQLFTYHLAVARGYDPESPPGLEKITRSW